jgi:hypothetical protein
VVLKTTVEGHTTTHQIVNFTLQFPKLNENKKKVWMAEQYQT